MHKYGLLYEDFVRAALGTFRHADLGSEGTFTRMRACYLDTGIDPYRGFYENSVNAGLHPGILLQCSLCPSADTECKSLCLRGMQRLNFLPAYSEGFRGSIHQRFIDADGYTGIARDNWGVGTNLFSTLPYWQYVNQQPNNNKEVWPQCSMDPDYSQTRAMAAGLPVENVFPDLYLSPEPPEPPSPPPSPPPNLIPSPPDAPPPPAPSPPPSPMGPTPAAAPANVGFAFSPNPPSPPPPTFMRRLLERIDLRGPRLDVQF